MNYLSYRNARSTAIKRREAKQERADRLARAMRGQPPESQPSDDLGPAPLTAGFERRLAERLAPGCFRVLAVPPML